MEILLLKIRIAVLWIFLAVATSASMILWFMATGGIDEIMSGMAEGMQISTGLLLFFLLFWLIPLAMAFLTSMSPLRTWSPKEKRWPLDNYCHTSRWACGYPSDRYRGDVDGDDHLSFCGRQDRGNLVEFRRPGYAPATRCHSPARIGRVVIPAAYFPMGIGY